MSKKANISRIVLIALVSLSIRVTANNSEDALNNKVQDMSYCDGEKPEFSYVHGRPNISSVSGSAGLTALLISWDVN